MSTTGKIIGIDASRAFLKRRTGIEEYAYQTIKHLRDALGDERVVLYVRKKFLWRDGHWVAELPAIDFELPKQWGVKGLWAPRFWTQIRLSLEILFHPVDALFVPAHTVPVIHPKHTVVVVHGLEYEFCPQAYSRWERWYMRWSIRASVRWASCVACVSQNTKRDVMRLYHVPEEKISVIGEGYEQSAVSNQQSAVRKVQKPFFLFIGRIEERKNVARIVEAFELFQKQREERGGQNVFQLVLAGKPGYGYEKIRQSVVSSQQKKRIVELGYVSETEKWELLSNATAFVFPSLYEGFGIPVLEAQSVGTPVITSSNSSLPEVSGGVALEDIGKPASVTGGAILVNPESVAEIAEAMERLVSDSGLKNAIIEKGKENTERYSWVRCARELAVLLKQ